MPPSTSGTPQRRQYTPNTASVAATRRSHHSRELEPSGHRVALDRGDHRLVEQHPRRPHGSVAVVGHRVPRAVPHRPQVGAGTERPGGAGQHRDGPVVVAREGSEGVGQRDSGGSVDRVAALGPVDRDDRDGPVVLDAHGHGRDPSAASRVPTRCAVSLSDPMLRGPPVRAACTRLIDV